MKTGKDIDQIIENHLIRLKREGSSLKKSVKTRIYNEIDFLVKIKIYLESSPSEEYILKQKNKMELLISKTEKGWDYYLRNCVPAGYDNKESRRLFNEETGLPMLKKSLKNLNFILE